jgi:hypothetical protein
LVKYLAKPLTQIIKKFIIFWLINVNYINQNVHLNYYESPHYSYHILTQVIF